MQFEAVYLARHGQMQWNQEGRKQGQLDSPLTVSGRAHASDLAQLALTLNPDLVASSPLGRARATARVCAEVLGMEVQVVDELAEVHHGSMAGLTVAEAQAMFPGSLDRRAGEKYRWRFPGGESYADADSRAAVALARVAETGSRTPLIVSHEMIGRMLLRNLLANQPADVLYTRQPHHVLYRVDPSMSQIDELVTQQY